MLKIKIELDTKIIMFNCPSCKASDSIYNNMPDTCFQCGKVYLFDVIELANDQHSRYEYYKQLL